jgi:hypothetical protein
MTKLSSPFTLLIATLQPGVPLHTLDLTAISETLKSFGLAVLAKCVFLFFWWSVVFSFPFPKIPLFVWLSEEKLWLQLHSWKPNMENGLNAA